VADDKGVLLAKRCDQRDHVADRVKNAVGADLGRRAGLPKPAHVGRHDMETGLGQGRNLVPPRIGQFRPAVAKHHQRALALFKDKLINSVGGNGAGGGHRVSAWFAGFC
jgi:hypothetical protein